MNSIRKIFSLALFCSASLFATAQIEGFSFSSDVSILRSFKKDQRFIVFGATSQGRFHITPKDEVYVWFSYYTNGNFKNEVTATAKQPATNPQQIAYTNKAKLLLRHISVGYRKYVKGQFNMEEGWGLYGFSGLGILFGSVTNIQTENIDTAMYNNPVLAGKGEFKRLTLDVGAGWEHTLSGDFYLYAEGRALIPTTDYPSKFLFVNNKAPLTGALTVGLRIIF